MSLHMKQKVFSIKDKFSPEERNEVFALAVVLAIDAVMDVQQSSIRQQQQLKKAQQKDNEYHVEDGKFILHMRLKFKHPDDTEPRRGFRLGFNFSGRFTSALPPAAALCMPLPADASDR